MTKGIVYYTCNTHDPAIDEPCRAQLMTCGLPIVSVSLNTFLNFGDHAITMSGTRSPLMMHRQILKGLEVCPFELVFLCESDVLYHPSHFSPPMPAGFLYNTHVWRMRWADGLAVWTDDLQQVSGVCAARAPLLDFYRQRVAQIERDGFNRHYEPGVKQSVGIKTVENWASPIPNICIRHDRNISASKWSPSEFRNQKYAKGWRETRVIPGWGRTQARSTVLLKDESDAA